MCQRENGQGEECWKIFAAELSLGWVDLRIVGRATQEHNTHSVYTRNATEMAGQFSNAMEFHINLFNTSGYWMY